MLVLVVYIALVAVFIYLTGLLPVWIGIVVIFLPFLTICVWLGSAAMYMFPGTQFFHSVVRLGISLLISAFILYLSVFVIGSEFPASSVNLLLLLLTSFAISIAFNLGSEAGYKRFEHNETESTESLQRRIWKLQKILDSRVGLRKNDQSVFGPFSEF